MLLILAQCAVSADPPNYPTKWTQLPDMDRGLDYSSEVKVPSIVAEDYLCQDGRPVTDFHWWGSYWYPGRPIPPDGSPHSDGYADAPPGGVEQFIIRFWGDVPAGQDPFLPFSHPGMLLQTMYTDGLQYNEVLYGTTNLAKKVYQYNVYFRPDQYFYQQFGNVYWVSVEAVFPDENRQWGWHESKDHWNDDAAQQFKYSDWGELVNNQYSVGMAFELSTIPEPGSLLALGLGSFGAIGCLLRQRRRV
jgi:hypothetical protein